MEPHTPNEGVVDSWNNNETDERDELNRIAVVVFDHVQNLVLPQDLKLFIGVSVEDEVV